METQEKLRNSILKKVKNLPDDKLSSLDAYLDDLESGFSSDRSPLSFIGIFEGIDLEELTTQLHKSREDIHNRIPQF